MGAVFVSVGSKLQKKQKFLLLNMKSTINFTTCYKIEVGTKFLIYSACFRCLNKMIPR